MKEVKNWKEVERRKAEDGRVRIAYEFAGYYIFVADACYMPGGLKIEAEAIDQNSYRPSIYIDNSFGQQTQKIKIQTTSWGALEIDEIDKVLAGYTEAQTVAHEIKNAFPECFSEN